MRRYTRILLAMVFVTSIAAIGYALKPGVAKAATECSDGITLNFDASGTWSCQLSGGTPHQTSSYVIWCYTYFHPGTGSVVTKGYANGDNGEREYSGTNSSSSGSSSGTSGSGHIRMAEGYLDNGTVGFRFTTNLSGAGAYVHGTIYVGLDTCPGGPVTKKPDLVPRGLGVVQAGPYTEGQTLKFSAKAYNRGEANAGPSKMQFFIDQMDSNHFIGRRDTPALGIGVVSSELLSNNWTAKRGRHSFFVCVDFTKVVSESDETNNCRRSDYFTIGAAPNITCTSGSGQVTVNWTFTGIPNPVHVYKNGTIWEGHEAAVTSPGSATDNVFPTGTNSYQLYQEGDSDWLDEASCGPNPTGERQPYATTIWKNTLGGLINTYGDVHAGGLARAVKNVFRKKKSDPKVISCQKTPSLATRYVQTYYRSIHGSLNNSGSSSAVSATGSIFGFGAGGSINPKSLLRLGNQDISETAYNYAFPICQYDNSADVGTIKEYAAQAGARPKAGTAAYNSHVVTRSRGGKKVVYIGSSKVHHDGDACGTKPGDIDRIVSLMENADPELMIWCDVRYQKLQKPAETICLPHGDCVTTPEGWIGVNHPIALKKLGGIKVRGRKTLYIQTSPRHTICNASGCQPKLDKNYAIKIVSNIEYDPSTVATTDQLPSFALVNNHSINISAGVSKLYGYYFAGVVTGNTGTIRTCNRNPAKYPAFCNRPLEVHGLLSAVSLMLWRTGNATNSSGPEIAEKIGGPEYGLVFVGAAPPGLKTETIGSDCDPEQGQDCTLQFEQNEQPPLF